MTESERIELQKSLVNEISKGMRQLKHLKVSSSSSDKEQERVLERMLSSYEEALFILTGGGAPGAGGQCQPGITSSPNPPGSSPSASIRQGSLARYLKKREMRLKKEQKSIPSAVDKQRRWMKRFSSGSRALSMKRDSCGQLYFNCFFIFLRLQLGLAYCITIDLILLSARLVQVG